ncbi:hypothetical protein AV530_012327 [Patagioenas fasciata monilis]|uniref:Alpha-macroglobulin receptor-binding domain-containing protein n=1 Tax=Patagioenas fasciata monilis TaxID=372326 RepID=A0A1V4JA69_PATFA|nr:hypothetical protein AV530_012327 [Patagioenas fasciata monilis]
MWILLSGTNHDAGSPCSPKLGSHGCNRAFWAMGPVVPQLLGSETLSFSFTVERDVPVQRLKPAQVKVYDYYETDEFATQEYSAPCTTGKVKTV